MFTLWPAYASFREMDLGTIEPGKLADFTGFTGDIMTVPAADILKVDPAMTAEAGRWSTGARSGRSRRRPPHATDARPRFPPKAPHRPASKLRAAPCG